MACQAPLLTNVLVCLSSFCSLKLYFQSDFFVRAALYDLHSDDMQVYAQGAQAILENSVYESFCDASHTLCGTVYICLYFNVVCLIILSLILFLFLFLVENDLSYVIQVMASCS